MVKLFGTHTAFSLLRCLEGSAKVRSKIIPLDRNLRLRQALDALNDNGFDHCDVTGENPVDNDRAEHA